MSGTGAIQAQYVRRWGSCIAVTAIFLAAAWAGYEAGELHAWARMPDVVAWLSLGTLVGATIWAAIAPSRRPTRNVGSCTPVGLLLLATVTVIACSTVSQSLSQVNVGDRVAGVIPYNDAESYYDVMAAWPMAELDPFNARRPVNAAINALESRLAGGDLRDILVLRTMILAASVAALGLAVACSAGRLAAASCCGILLFWTLPYAASCLTEVTGISLSAAATALLLLGIKSRSWSAVGAAAVGLALAWVVRPGNPLYPMALAATGAWCSCSGRGRKRAAAVAATTCATIMIVVPPTMTAALGSPGSMANSNMSHVVLGIAAGTDWKQARALVAAETKGKTESEQAAIRYRKALELVMANPVRAASAALKGPWNALSHPAGLVAQLGDALHLEAMWLRWCVTLLVMAAIGVALRRPGPVVIVAAIGVVGFLLGAPLLWESGKWRATGALFPGLAIAVAALPAGAAVLRDSVRGAARAMAVEGSADTWSLVATVAIIALPLAACAYTVATVGGPATPATGHWVRVEFGGVEPGAGRWIDGHTAVAAPADLAAWAVWINYPALAAYATRNAAELLACRRELGGFIIEVEPGATPPAAGGTLEYTFRIEERVPAGKH